MDSFIRGGCRATARIVMAAVAATMLVGAMAAPASAAEDVTFPVIVSLYPPDPGDPSPSVTSCTSRSRTGDAYAGQYGEICIARSGDRVRGTAAYTVGSGSVRVILDVHAYRCRVSDDVCVEISNEHHDGFINTGTVSIGSEWTTQTWSDRYYKSCGYIWVSSGFSFDGCAQKIT